MSSTISDFLQFFRPGKEKVLFPVEEEVRHTVALVESGFHAAGVPITVEVATGFTVWGFPNEFAQVLLNLLGNARQAMVEADMLPGAITVRLSREEQQGCLSVRDTGPGIREAILDRIFEPYFSTRPTGSGIGLYMSRQIVEQSMGGRLTARNVDGGAEFRVLIPLAEVDS